MEQNSIDQLLKEAKKYYRKNGRSHLPWRNTSDPYKIMVSEIMLQQTQVGRVIPFYKNFIKQFPTFKMLAKAPLADVLKAWSGLGYNRRAKMFRDAARTIVKIHNGKLPIEVEEIEQLPGIGPYTARAIATFAFSQPEIFIETNIRTVFFNCLFTKLKKIHIKKGHGVSLKTQRRLGQVDDEDILPYLEKALEQSKMEPREFYWMLMDYGSYLKKLGIRLNSQSKHYTKQSKFEGSRRQLRGQILKLLLQKPQTAAELNKQIKRKSTEVKEELNRLEKENLISLQRKKKKFMIAK